MANEANIKVNVEADTTQLDDLAEMLQNIEDKSTEAGEKISADMNAAFNEIDGTAIVATTDQVINEFTSLDNVLTQVMETDEEFANEVVNSSEGIISGVTNVESEFQSLDNVIAEVGATLSEMDSGAADNLATSMDNLASSAENAANATNGLADAENNEAGAADNAGDSTQGAADNIDYYADAVSAATSLGLAAEFSNTATAADNYKVSMAALNQVAANNNISMDAVSSAITRVTDATSIGAGQARSYFSLLMNMGVTNTDALADSMIYLKAQTAITGGSVEEMESKMTRLVNSTSIQSRALNTLGLSLQGVAEKNGMTVDQLQDSWSTLTADEKIQILNNAMSENVGLLDTMNATTSEKLAEVKLSWSALERKVGSSTSAMSQAVLGVVNGALRGLSGALDSIPFASTFAGGVMAVGSLVTAVSPALDTFNTLSRSVQNAKQLWDELKGAASTLGTIMGITAAETDAETLAAGANSVAVEAEGVAAETSSTGFWSLAAAELAAAAPIIILIAVIAALIAIFIYLYTTNDQVKAAVDNFGQTLMNVGQIIWDSLINAIQNVINFFLTLGQTITTFVTTAITSIINFVSQAIQAFVNFLVYMATLPIRVGTYLSQVISRVASWAVQFISKMASTAINAVSRFISGIAQLPGKVYNELAKTFNKVVEWGSQIVAKLGEIAQKAWQAFINGLGIGSPGYIQIKTIKELWDTAKRIPESMPTAVRNLEIYAHRMVSAYGDPELPAPKIKGGVLSNLPSLDDIKGKGFVELFTGKISNNDNNGATVYRDERTINVEVGSVDNEDRVQEILDAITKALSWDNTTAGRTN